jgi:hypothetical protein
MNTTESRHSAARLADLLKNERHAMADFLLALAEFDRRRGWIQLGYSSLFTFLTGRLELSKAAAFFRFKAAGLIQRYPEIVAPLRDGRLCITTMASLARVLTPENSAAVLPRFFHLSKQEAKGIAAEFLPVANPPRRTVVTTVLVAPIANPPETTSQTVFLDEPNPPKEGPMPSKDPVVALEPAMRVEPLTATVRRVHLTVSDAFLEKLEAARLALSHSMPGASEEDVLAAGLDLLLARDAKNKALVEKPRSTTAEVADAPEFDRVSAAARREVWRRDGGACQWLLDSGGVCGSRLRVELDHIIPVALGGRSVIGNLRLLCDCHNRWAARQKLGHGLMNRYCRDPRQPMLAGLPGETSGG